LAPPGPFSDNPRSDGYFPVTHPHAVGAHKAAGVLAVVNVSHFAVRTVGLGALGVVAFAAGFAADLALGWIGFRGGRAPRPGVVVSPL